MTEKTQWWHAFSGLVTEWGGEEWDPGLHALMIFGPSPVTPEEAPNIEAPTPNFVYVGSWDHEPTQEEKDEVTPEEYLDDLD